MRDAFKEAFDAIHADEKLKADTRAYVFTRMARQRRRPAAVTRALMPAMACVLILLLGLGGHRLYFTPTSTVSIDVNPSLEIYVNRFDRVVGVQGFGDDGDALAGTLEVAHLGVEQAVEQVLQSDVITGCLARDEIVSILVVGEDERQSGRIFSRLEACTAGQKNLYCACAKPEEVEQAHELGLSYGKYRAFLEAQAVHPELTAQDVQGMTMRQIRSLMEAPQTEQDGETGEAFGGYGSARGPMDGSGNGWGSGRRKQQGEEKKMEEAEETP